MRRLDKYPKTHTSVDWTLGMAIAVRDVLKREHKLDVDLPPELVNKVAATHLGHDLSTYNHEAIARDTIREIARYLLPKAKKLHDEKPPNSHFWSRNDPSYIKRKH